MDFTLSAVRPADPEPGTKKQPGIPAHMERQCNAGINTVFTDKSLLIIFWLDNVMHHGTAFPPLKTKCLALSLVLFCILGIAGCEEANGSASPSSQASRAEGQATPPVSAPSAPSTPPSAEKLLPVPANVASGSKVILKCGHTYQGTLDLRRKSNIVVSTQGDCGKASITPGRAVSGWTKYKGNIYSAPIEFVPVQVSVAGQPIDLAHWPNRPKTWADAGIDVVPGNDLDGATLVYLKNQSVVEAEIIRGNHLPSSKPYYVEGKLWMLDSPGEWAVSEGQLYVWAQDGRSPEGRVWVTPNSNGIDADHSSNITIDGVRIYSSRDGISGNTSVNLRILNTEIINSARDGVWASGSRGLVVDNTTVVNSVRSGIDGWYSIIGAQVTNSTVINSGTVGRHKPTDAGIMFGDGRDNKIDNVRVINSGYHGISVLHNRHTSVTNSVIDTACTRLTDCAGIYTGARDQLPLNLRIEGNTVRNIRGSEGIGIYLDDHANKVSVTRNLISGCTTGMVLHNAFDNVITHNIFESNMVAHLKFGQDQGRIRDNRVTDNTFRSTNGEQTFNLETGSNLRTFAIFDHNTYSSSKKAVFGRIWDGKSPGVSYSYKDWKKWMGQDENSVWVGDSPANNRKKH